MNIIGVIIAVASFLVIGIFHPIVIKAEYYLSARCWPIFLILGLIFLGISTQIKNVIGSSLLGVVGCSCLWSILELKEQEKRVKKGWFPRNPKR